MAKLNKNKGGRPLIFKTPEAMQKKIDEYFDYCDNRIQQVYHPKSNSVIEVVKPAPYTILGLCRVLGMERQSLLNYAEKDKFFDTIKAAKAKVGEDVETRSFEGAAAGAIFNLKNNFGYMDEQKVVGDGDKPIIIKLSKDEEAI